ncbi:MAG: hypothetical protein KAR20_20700 [Candidatus Heimdallarchaeota archaeon]|nr:hypothetical protein [Candidatus Heimdallarchaeota archaeon]
MKRNLIILVFIAFLIGHICIQNEFNAAFPENADTGWIYQSVSVNPKGLLFEVEPNVSDIGYARFKFSVNLFGIVECFVMGNSGGWELLFTDL